MNPKWLPAGLSVGLAGIVLVGLAGCRQAAANEPARPSRLFVVAGATQLTVAAKGWNEWQIRYQAPGTPATWYADVARQLEADGWSSPDPAGYAPLNRTFVRSSPFAAGEVREWAFVFLDPMAPRTAQIRVRRAIDVPWLRRLRNALQPG